MEPECSLYCLQEPPLVPILSQMNSDRKFPSYFPKIHSNVILPSTTRSPEWSVPFRLSKQILYSFLIIPMHAICPVHLILLDSMRTSLQYKSEMLPLEPTCLVMTTPRSMVSFQCRQLCSSSINFISLWDPKIHHHHRWMPSWLTSINFTTSQHILWNHF